MANNTKSLSLRTPFRDAASSAINSALGEIDSNWKGALSATNPDALHDLRVGTRRLRAALSVYEAVLPKREAVQSEKLVAELTDILGPARDADVLIEHLESVAKRYESENKEDSVGIKSLVDFTRKSREHEQTRLTKALRDFDIDQLKDDVKVDGGKNTQAGKKA